jgi:CDP-glucose 4,6-dehydratase
MVINTTFWQKKRVLITGHTGFKGSWLALWLSRLGAEVTGFALAPPTQPSLFELARVGENMRSILGDIRDAAAVRAAVREARPEIVFHLAAQALVRQSYADPVETYATNVMGLAHLFEAARESARQGQPVRALVSVTSDKCYENREWLWGYRETEPLGGHDPYSSSKACAELVTAAYRNSFFNAPDIQNGQNTQTFIATARAGNVIGGGDWAKDRLITDILNAIASGQPLRLRNPQAIRPWQHVLEPLNGYLMLAEKLFSEGAAYASAWNFGSADEDAKPVQWIVERLAEYWKKQGQNPVRWEIDSAPQPHEAHYLKLDCSKSRALLGWRPRWNLETALERIVQWQGAWQSGQDMRDFTLRQIAAFLEP